MRKLVLSAGIVCFLSSTAFSQINKDRLTQLKNTVTKSDGSVSLSNEDIVSGLKEALTVGAKNAVDVAGVTDGFYGNSLIYIPFPESATSMKDRLVKMGLEKQIASFEKSLNNAAEIASKEAISILSSSITSMSVTDGLSILKGSDTSATHYLRTSTNEQLTATFSPIVKSAIEKVNVTQYWNVLATTYNKIPGVAKQNPDLDAYVTQKAINGLMILISQKEKDIRNNASAQVSDLLKKVFGK